MSLLKKFLKYGEQEYTHKKLGLERVQDVLSRLGNPQETYPSVLIGGTNGKGSVGRMLESVLLQAGYLVGLYSSPHLENFTERIRIGGKEVSQSELEEALQFFLENKVLNPEGFLTTSQGDPLTWFEKVTVLALEIFRRREVPLALLEVGLGGRLDATNVVDPLVSIITSIGLDHTEVLGDSLFEIAKEKAAIMRPGKPIVLGLMDPNVRTFLMKATRMGEAKPITPFMPKGSVDKFSYGPFDNLKLSLKGAAQLNNAATAIETLVVLKERGFQIENSHVREGLAHAQFPGRMEILNRGPTLIFDGAHNEDSFANLVTELKRNYVGRPITILMGMMREKDSKRICEQLLSLQAQVVFTEVSSPRSVSLDQWAELGKGVLKPLGPKLIANPEEAFAWAKAQTPPEGVLVVTGSLYLVGEVRKFCR